MMKRLIKRGARTGALAITAAIATAFVYACTLETERGEVVAADAPPPAPAATIALDHPAGGFTTSFLADGTTKFRAGASSSIEIGLRSAVEGAVTLHQSATRATFERPNVREWFEHRADGIEHTIVIQSRNPGRGKGEALTVDLEWEGATPTIARGGSDLLLLTAGTTTLHYANLAAFDANHRALPAKHVVLDAHRSRIEVSDDDDTTVYPVTIDPRIWSEQARLHEIHSIGRDGLGSSLVVDGDHLIAGFSGRNSNRGGEAFFERSDASWTQTYATTPAPDSVRSTYWGLNSALSGDIAVVGSWAPGYVYERGDQDAGWHPTAVLNVPWNKLGGPNTTPVAISGNTAVLSLTNWLPNNGVGVEAGTRPGALFVFDRLPDAGWTDPKNIPYPTTPAFYTYGNIVMNGDTLALNEGTFLHIFRRNSDGGGNDSVTWDLEQSIRPPTGTTDFLQGVALDGNDLVIGAGDYTKNPAAFYATFFHREGATWTFVQKFLETTLDGTFNQLAGSNFGFAAAIKGDVAFVGDYERTGPGSIFRYDRVGPANAPWEIGRGGMGIVYRVTHKESGEALALKVLIGAARFDPQAVARFKREARAATRIGSDHVVRVIDADTAPELDGAPFLVMELLRGTDLEKLITHQGPLDKSAVISVLLQVASVLEKAHKLGIVHRDLKPENLFLHQRADGTTVAKVLDFGISKFVSTAMDQKTLETAAGMTSTGSVLGTPLYMAPEQAHGQNEKVNATTDVWAIGLVAMRLLTGEHYWGIPTMVELMMKIAVKDLVAPTERWPGHAAMSKELDAWFFRSVNRDQDKRWSSVAEQVDELAKALQIAPPSAIPNALPIDISKTLVLANAPPRPKPLAYAETVVEEEERRRAMSASSEAMSALSRSAKASSSSSSSKPVRLGRPLAFVVGVGAIVVLGVGGASYMNLLKSRASSVVSSTTFPSTPPAATSSPSSSSITPEPEPYPAVSALPSASVSAVSSAVVPPKRPGPFVPSRPSVAVSVSARSSAPAPPPSASSLYAPLAP